LPDFDSVVESYLETLDDVQCLEYYGDDEDSPRLDGVLRKLKDLRVELLRIGGLPETVVRCECDLKGNQVLVTGRLVELNRDKCYVADDRGNWEGAAVTLEIVE